MAKDHCKLESHSAKEKFQSQDTLSALNSAAQNLSDAESSCEPHTQWQPQPTHTETHLATLRCTPWWRLQLAVVWFSGIFPESERLQLCSLPVLSITTVAPPRPSRYSLL
ncbi:hypothetical protein [Reinekea sp. G2M2-21]|uniref:hypothetical protein n=1 Tax=Reinekea sp. G2M2-21 TaxID=2788942 RepID=UPI0018AA4123|nr:hypothetical protein [Reinekea sp. G2M2-21]